MSGLSATRDRIQCIPVARILQQYPQPRNLYCVLAGISTGIQKDAVRWYAGTSLTVDLIPLLRARGRMKRIRETLVHIYMQYMYIYVYIANELASVFLSVV